MIPVADAVCEDGNNFFAYKEGFKSCGITLDGIDLEESGAPEAAGELAAWVREKGMEGTKKEIDESGSVSFEDLDLGLYLFVQDEAAEGHDLLRPFLVTVPLWNGEELIYDVEAGPKPGTAAGLAFAEFPVKKIFQTEGGTAPEDGTFSFCLSPDQADYPMPASEDSSADPITGAVSITHGAGSFTFGKIWFGLEDEGRTYTYEISEVPGADPRITYDRAVYKAVVEVQRNADSGNMECTVSIAGPDGKEVSEAVFVNICQNSPSLPQTGQLWWPVPLLAIAGILLFTAGKIISSRGR